MNKNRSIPSLSARINNIIELTLEGLIPYVQPLAVAIYLSSSDEFTRIRQCYPGGHPIHQALDLVRAFCTDEAVFKLCCSSGFFARQLEEILLVAKSDLDAGTRLMPVLHKALSETEWLQIPADLKERIRQHMEWQCQKDGFAIISLTLDGTVVVPAEDVSAAYC